MLNRKSFGALIHCWSETDDDENHLETPHPCLLLGSFVLFFNFLAARRSIGRVIISFLSHNNAHWGA